MAAEYPPFMFGYGAIGKIVAKIQDHPVPEVFSHEFLSHKLGFGRESDRAFIPMAKRIGLLGADGKPTPLYERLREPPHVPAAIAEAMKNGYPMFYGRHADAHELDRKVLAELVADITGLVKGHASARAIVGTFFALKSLAAPAPPATERRKVPERRGT